MLSKAFNRYKLPKTFLVKIKKIIKKKNNLTVFEPKDPLRGCHGTCLYAYLISLGQSPWGMAMCLVWQSVLLGNG